MLILLQSQQQCLTVKDSRAMRWDKSLIKVCLTLWTQSPNSYTMLRSSGLLLLPSESLLKKYKNCFEQCPGFTDETVSWMNSEAEKENCDKCGGIILDEMSVQEDLSVEFRGDVMKLEGMVDLGEASNTMYQGNKKPKSDHSDIRLASHILQFIFLGYDGFRFPFGYFATKGANAPELFLAVSNALQKLLSYGFQVDFLCFDGACANRVLMHMFFNSDAQEKNFTCCSLFSNVPITFMMDPSHVLKRVRNNIYSSAAASTPNGRGPWVRGATTLTSSPQRSTSRGIC